MHAVHAVAGVKKLVQQLPLQPMVLFQRVQGRANGVGIRRHQLWRRRAMRFALNVLHEQFGRVIHLQRGL